MINECHLKCDKSSTSVADTVTDSPGKVRSVEGNRRAGSRLGHTHSPEGLFSALFLGFSADLFGRVFFVRRERR
jgi:hypothetical protein